MLIRIISHPTQNKWYADKMINIEGIPESLLYFKRNGKNFLKEPWAIDTTENIPAYVRAAHQPKPFIVNKYAASPAKDSPPLEDEIEAYGLTLDYQNGQGAQMWEQVERMIDQNTPRGERIPLPVVVEPEMDNEHRARGFTVEAHLIPVVHLEGFDKKESKAPVIVVDQKAPEEFPCLECPKIFAKAQGLRMHKMKSHAKAVAAA